MMHIGQVRVLVGQRRVLVDMRVGLPGRLVMLVDVVLVVNMRVIVLHRLVDVHVLVFGPQEHDNAGPHDCHREELTGAEVLREQSRGNERTDERRGREVGRLSCCAQQAKRAHRKHDAQAVAEESEDHPVAKLP